MLPRLSGDTAAQALELTAEGINLLKVFGFQIFRMIGVLFYACKVMTMHRNTYASVHSATAHTHAWHAPEKPHVPELAPTALLQCHSCKPQIVSRFMASVANRKSHALHPCEEDAIGTAARKAIYCSWLRHAAQCNSNYGHLSSAPLRWSGAFAPASTEHGLLFWLIALAADCGSSSRLGLCDCSGGCSILLFLKLLSQAKVIFNRPHLAAAYLRRVRQIFLLLQAASQALV
mmetsp:Transcript_76862/g.139797  ORF Transcript_76862/g.139797 Transcript_76862/m.139797 type:complete len:232 (+) Transcript_76862:244-939(+)